MYQFNRKEYEERMKWYQDARFGMFIHWGLYSIPARGEWVRSTEEMPEEEYLPFMKEFDGATATDSALCKSSRICKSICDPDGKCRYVFCASAKIKKWKKRGRVYDNYKSDGSV